ncbi:MAG: HAD family hydrolase [Ruminococcus sp.]|nr:HAD family hydrolase [Ruminococcus sp.]
MRRLCIFDLDGTLVNSVEDLADSTNEALKKFGCPVHEVDKYRYFVGNGTLKLIERALPEELRTPEMISRVHGCFAQEYEKRLVNKTCAYEGIKDVLKNLKARGFLLAVASNKPDRFAKEVTLGIFGEGLFDRIFGKKDGVPVKPAPDIIFGLVDALGADLAGCIHCGDSAVDVNTAHNAGIPCIGCTWGFRERSELEEAGADMIADRPEDIYKYMTVSGC